jgi:hypothetical protein
MCAPALDAPLHALHAAHHQQRRVFWLFDVSVQTIPRCRCARCLALLCAAEAPRPRPLALNMPAPRQAVGVSLEFFLGWVAGLPAGVTTTQAVQDLIIPATIKQGGRSVLPIHAPASLRWCLHRTQRIERAQRGPGPTRTAGGSGCL